MSEKIDSKKRKRQEPQTDALAEIEEASPTPSPETSEPAAARAGTLVIDEKATFASLGVDEALCSACEALGYKHPSDIQREALPHALKGHDIIGLAETGSGKTAAFALPILQSLLDEPQPFHSVVMAPVRELAFQIAEQFKALGSEIGVKVIVLTGGVDMTDQSIQLAHKPHVIVATPGRLIDHLENTKGFTLRNLQCLVFDEADRLLNMDFEKEINKLLAAIPRKRRTYLYSATMTSKVAKLQRASLSNPVKVEVSRRYQTVKTLKQQYLFIPAKFKDVYLAAVMNDLVGKSMMIFTDTVRATRRVTYLLRALGFGAVPLHGKLSQPKRLGALNKFKSGARAILVATDVASRGLDIPQVDVVVNYDVPTKSKDYIHRVGRTARAGRSGRAVNLVSQYDVELFQRIEQLIELKMEEYPHDDEAVMMFNQSVSAAQRTAIMEMKDEDMKRKDRGNTKRRRRR